MFLKCSWHPNNFLFIELKYATPALLPPDSQNLLSFDLIFPYEQTFGDISMEKRSIQQE